MEHDEKTVLAVYKNAVKNGALPIGVPQRVGKRTAVMVVCEELDMPRTTVRRKLASALAKNPVPLSEDQRKFHEEWTAEDCIRELKRIAEIDSDKVITRN